MSAVKIEEMIQIRLKALWLTSKTEREICRELGITYERFVKYKRALGLPPRSIRSTKAAPFGLLKPVSQDSEILENPPKKIARVKLGKPVKLEELTKETCRYPIGDPTKVSFHFCGQPVSVGVYCSEHYKDCTEKPRIVDDSPPKYVRSLRKRYR